jgi:hypothetical protein
VKSEGVCCFLNSYWGGRINGSVRGGDKSPTINYLRDLVVFSASYQP